MSRGSTARVWQSAAHGALLPAGAEPGGIAVDGSGHAWVTGGTENGGFPTTPNAFDRVCGTNGDCRLASDVYVARLKPDGRELDYSTFLGGAGRDRGDRIAVDRDGKAYVLGGANGFGFPVTSGAFNPTDGFGVFVAKLDPAQSGAASLVYSAVLGDGAGRGIAVDGQGNAHVTGTTNGSPFPTKNALQPTYGGNQDAFVAKLNATGRELVFSTFLGGPARDEGAGIALDGAGNIYVVGYTDSEDFPTRNALQTDRGGLDAFVTKLKVDGSELVYSTYFGGEGGDLALGVAVAGDSAYLVGTTFSAAGFPRRSAVQDSFMGHSDAFVAKILDRPLEADLEVTLAESADPVTTATGLTHTVVVKNNGPALAQGADLRSTLGGPAAGGLGSLTATVTPAGPGRSCTIGATIVCLLGDLASGASATVTIAITPGIPGALTHQAQVQSTVTDPNTTNNTAAIDTTIRAPDLALTKSHVGDFTEGQQGVYTLGVRNGGDAATTGPITVTDSLVPGLRFVSGTGTGASWTCSAAAPDQLGRQLVTCTSQGPLAVQAETSIALTVNVGSEALPRVTNAATVQTPGDPNGANNQDDDPTEVIPTTSKPRFTLALNFGNACTTNPVVKMVLTVENPETQPTRMRFGLDPTNLGSFVALVNGTDFELGSGDGQKQAFAQLQTARDVSSDVVSDTILLDTIQVVATIESPSPLTNQSRPPVRIVLVDEGSGIKADSIELRIDGGEKVGHTFTPTETAPDGRVTRGVVTFQPAQDLSNGQHSLQFSASDNCGNPARLVEQQVIVDTVPPQIKPPVQQPGGGGGGVFDFTLPGGNDGKVVFDGKDVDLEFPFEGDKATVEPPPLPEGTYTILVEVKDEAGNVATQTFPFVVDLNPPIVTFGIPSPAANGAGWNNGDVSIPFTAEDRGSGIQSTNPVASPLVLTAEGAAVSGTVTATDKQNKVTTATSPVVKIDKTPPTITSAQTPAPDGEGRNSGPVTVTFECGDALSGVATCNEPVTVSEPGTRVVTGTAVDRAGNTATTRRTVTIAAGPQPVNSALRVVSTTTAYNAADTRAPAGVYTITATFEDVGALSLAELSFQAATLTNGNVVLNRDGAPGSVPTGVGARLAVPPTALGDDARLSPAERFVQVFEIGLQARRSFTFFVDAYGAEAPAVGPLSQGRAARASRQLLSGALGEFSPEEGSRSAPAACSPRPEVGVATVADGPGRLAVTLTARASAGTPDNALRELRFGAATNARIDLAGGPTDSRGGLTYTPPSGTKEVRFVVRRAEPGAPIHVPLEVVDACGGWRTFVGAGASAP